MTQTIRTRYTVGGMDCAGCAAKIDTAVRRVEGIDAVSVSVVSGLLTIDHRAAADLGIVEKKIRGLGYDVSPLVGPAVPSSMDHSSSCGHHHDSHDHGQSSKPENLSIPSLHGHDHGLDAGKWWAGRKGRLTILSGLALVLAYGLGHMVPSVGNYAFIVAMLTGLFPIARRALMAALAGTPFSIEMLMTIAAIGAVVINAAEEAAAVVFLFLVGELLEGFAAGKARQSIQALAALVPKTAFLDDDGVVREVAADSLSIGAMIIVRPGDRIPADGTIVSGEGAIDEAPVTGESTPVSKGPGQPVFAGTINANAVLRVEVRATAADNTISRVVRLVEEAQESKAPTERFIDRFSHYYTPGVVVVSLLVAILPPLLGGASWSEWIYKGLAILLIGCPCALVISTPAAIAASLSAGARRGLLIKGGAVLETLGAVTAIALDKTGTLTSGKPQVTDVIGFSLEQRQVLAYAAALEAGSSHPLGAAVLARAQQEGVVLPLAEDATALGGKGILSSIDGSAVFFGSSKAAHEMASLSSDQQTTIERLNAEGKTVSVLVVSNAVAGAIAMRDALRPDAQAGVAALAKAGLHVVMLTGDNALAAKAIGAQLGIEVRAELMPEDKQRIVRELQQQGLIVAKVGDGINDAPALAAADVGIAMGGGTDVALETADAAILHSRVVDIGRMIALSKRTLRNIHQNIAIALGLKAIFLVTTIVGITGLWPAILADTGATVLVTINALLLLKPSRDSAA